MTDIAGVLEAAVAWFRYYENNPDPESNEPALDEAHYGLVVALGRVLQDADCPEGGVTPDRDDLADGFAGRGFKCAECGHEHYWDRQVLVACKMCGKGHRPEAGEEE